LCTAVHKLVRRAHVVEIRAIRRPHNRGARSLDFTDKGRRLEARGGILGGARGKTGSRGRAISHHR
jgi:hypothetical protein